MSPPSTETAAVSPFWGGISLIPVFVWRFLLGITNPVIKLYNILTGRWNVMKYKHRLLLCWLEEVSNREVPDLKSIWNDGSILCDAIHSIVPGVCDELRDHQGNSLRHAQDLATHVLHLPPGFNQTELQKDLSPPMEKRFWRYLLSLKHALMLKSTRSTVEEEDVPEYLIADEYVARGMGLITACINQRAIFFIYTKDESSLADIMIEVRGPNGEYGTVTSGEDTDIDCHFIPVDYRLNSDYLKVCYQPKSLGSHEIYLTRYGFHIPGSPFHVNVEETYGLALERYSNRQWFSEELEEAQKREEERRKNMKVVSRVIDFVTEKMYLTDDGKLIKINEENKSNLVPPYSNRRGRTGRSLSPRPRSKKIIPLRSKSVNSQKIIQAAECIQSQYNCEKKKSYQNVETQVSENLQLLVFQERCQNIVTTCDFLLNHVSKQKSLEIITMAENILETPCNESRIILTNKLITNKNEIKNQLSQEDDNYDDEEEEEITSDNLKCTLTDINNDQAVEIHKTIETSVDSSHDKETHLNQISHQSVLIESLNENNIYQTESEEINLNTQSYIDTTLCNNVMDNKMDIQCLLLSENTSANKENEAIIINSLQHNAEDARKSFKTEGNTKQSHSSFAIIDSYNDQLKFKKLHNIKVKYFENKTDNELQINNSIKKEYTHNIKTPTRQGKTISKLIEKFENPLSCTEIISTEEHNLIQDNVIFNNEIIKCNKKKDISILSSTNNDNNKGISSSIENVLTNTESKKIIETEGNTVNEAVLKSETDETILHCMKETPVKLMEENIKLDKEEYNEELDKNDGLKESNEKSTESEEKLNNNITSELKITSEPKLEIDCSNETIALTNELTNPELNNDEITENSHPQQQSSKLDTRNQSKGNLDEVPVPNKELKGPLYTKQYQVSSETDKIERTEQETLNITDTILETQIEESVTELANTTKHDLSIDTLQGTTEFIKIEAYEEGIAQTETHTDTNKGTCLTEEHELNVISENENKTVENLSESNNALDVDLNEISSKTDSCSEFFDKTECNRSEEEIARKPEEMEENSINEGELDEITSDSIINVGTPLESPVNVIEHQTKVNEVSSILINDKKSETPVIESKSSESISQGLIIKEKNKTEDENKLEGDSSGIQESTIELTKKKELNVNDEKTGELKLTEISGENFKFQVIKQIDKMEEENLQMQLKLQLSLGVPTKLSETIELPKSNELQISVTQHENKVEPIEKDVISKDVTKEKKEIIIKLVQECGNIISNKNTEHISTKNETEGNEAITYGGNVIMERDNEGFSENQGRIHKILSEELKTNQDAVENYEGSSANIQIFNDDIKITVRESEYEEHKNGTIMIKEPSKSDLELQNIKISNSDLLLKTAENQTEKTLPLADFVELEQTNITEVSASGIEEEIKKQTNESTGFSEEETIMHPKQSEFKLYEENELPNLDNKNKNAAAIDFTSEKVITQSLLEISNAFNKEAIEIDNELQIGKQLVEQSRLIIFHKTEAKLNEFELADEKHSKIINETTLKEVDTSKKAEIAEGLQQVYDIKEEIKPKSEHEEIETIEPTNKLFHETHVENKDVTTQQELKEEIEFIKEQNENDAAEPTEVEIQSIIKETLRQFSQELKEQELPIQTGVQQEIIKIVEKPFTPAKSDTSVEENKVRKEEKVNETQDLRVKMLEEEIYTATCVEIENIDPIQSILPQEIEAENEVELTQQQKETIVFTENETDKKPLEIMEVTQLTETVKDLTEQELKESELGILESGIKQIVKDSEILGVNEVAPKPSGEIEMVNTSPQMQHITFENSLVEEQKDLIQPTTENLEITTIEQSEIKESQTIDIQKELSSVYQPKEVISVEKDVTHVEFRDPLEQVSQEAVHQLSVQTNEEIETAIPVYGTTYQETEDHRIVQNQKEAATFSITSAKMENIEQTNVVSHQEIEIVSNFVLEKQVEKAILYTEEQIKEETIEPTESILPQLNKIFASNAQEVSLPELKEIPALQTDIEVLDVVKVPHLQEIANKDLLVKRQTDTITIIAAKSELPMQEQAEVDVLQSTDNDKEVYPMLDSRKEILSTGKVTKEHESENSLVLELEKSIDQHNEETDQEKEVLIPKDGMTSQEKIETEDQSIKEVVLTSLTHPDIENIQLKILSSVETETVSEGISLKEVEEKLVSTEKYTTKIFHLSEIDNKETSVEQLKDVELKTAKTELQVIQPSETEVTLTSPILYENKFISSKKIYMKKYELEETLVQVSEPQETVDQISVETNKEIEILIPTDETALQEIGTEDQTEICLEEIAPYRETQEKIENINPSKVIEELEIKNEDLAIYELNEEIKLVKGTTPQGTETITAVALEEQGILYEEIQIEKEKIESTESIQPQTEIVNLFPIQDLKENVLSIQNDTEIVMMDAVKLSQSPEIEIKESITEKLEEAVQPTAAAEIDVRVIEQTDINVPQFSEMDKEIPTMHNSEEIILPSGKSITENLVENQISEKTADILSVQNNIQTETLISKIETVPQEIETEYLIVSDKVTAVSNKIYEQIENGDILTKQLNQTEPSKVTAYQETKTTSESEHMTQVEEATLWKQEQVEKKIIEPTESISSGISTDLKDHPILEPKEEIQSKQANIETEYLDSTKVLQLSEIEEQELSTDNVEDTAKSTAVGKEINLEGPTEIQVLHLPENIKEAPPVKNVKELILTTGEDVKDTDSVDQMLEEKNKEIELIINKNKIDFQEIETEDQIVPSKEEGRTRETQPEIKSTEPNKIFQETALENNELLIKQLKETETTEVTPLRETETVSECLRVMQVEEDRVYIEKEKETIEPSESILPEMSTVTKDFPIPVPKEEIPILEIVTETEMTDATSGLQLPEIEEKQSPIEALENGVQPTTLETEVKQMESTENEITQLPENAKETTTVHNSRQLILTTGKDKLINESEETSMKVSNEIVERLTLKTNVEVEKLIHVDEIVSQEIENEEQIETEKELVTCQEELNEIDNNEPTNIGQEINLENKDQQINQLNETEPTMVTLSQESETLSQSTHVMQVEEAIVWIEKQVEKKPIELIDTISPTIDTISEVMKDFSISELKEEITTIQTDRETKVTNITKEPQLREIEEKSSSIPASQLEDCTKSTTVETEVKLIESTEIEITQLLENKTETPPLHNSNELIISTRTDKSENESEESYIKVTNETVELHYVQTNVETLIPIDDIVSQEIKTEDQIVPEKGATISTEKHAETENIEPMKAIEETKLENEGLQIKQLNEVEHKKTDLYFHETKTLSESAHVIQVEEAIVCIEKQMEEEITTLQTDGETEVTDITKEHQSSEIQGNSSSIPASQLEDPLKSSAAEIEVIKLIESTEIEITQLLENKTETPPLHNSNELILSKVKDISENKSEEPSMQVPNETVELHSVEANDEVAELISVNEILSHEIKIEDQIVPEKEAVIPGETDAETQNMEPMETKFENEGLQIKQLNETEVTKLTLSQETETVSKIIHVTRIEEGLVRTKKQVEEKTTELTDTISPQIITALKEFSVSELNDEITAVQTDRQTEVIHITKEPQLPEIEEKPSIIPAPQLEDATKSSATKIEVKLLETTQNEITQVPENIKETPSLHNSNEIILFTEKDKSESESEEPFMHIHNEAVKQLSVQTNAEVEKLISVDEIVSQEIKVSTENLSQSKENEKDAFIMDRIEEYITQTEPLVQENEDLPTSTINEQTEMITKTKLITNLENEILYHNQPAENFRDTDNMFVTQIETELINPKEIGLSLLSETHIKPSLEINLEVEEQLIASNVKMDIIESTEDIAIPTTEIINKDLPELMKMELPTLTIKEIESKEHIDTLYLKSEEKNLKEEVITTAEEAEIEQIEPTKVKLSQETEIVNENLAKLQINKAEVQTAIERNTEKQDLEETIKPAKETISQENNVVKDFPVPILDLKEAYQISEAIEVAVAEQVPLLSGIEKKDPSVKKINDEIQSTGEETEIDVTNVNALQVTEIEKGVLPICELNDTIRTEITMDDSLDQDLEKATLSIVDSVASTSIVDVEVVTIKQSEVISSQNTDSVYKDSSTNELEETVLLAKMQEEKMDKKYESTITSEINVMESKSSSITELKNEDLLMPELNPVVIMSAGTEIQQEIIPKQEIVSQITDAIKDLPGFISVPEETILTTDTETFANILDSKEPLPQLTEIEGYPKDNLKEAIVTDSNLIVAAEPEQAGSPQFTETEKEECVTKEHTNFTEEKKETMEITENLINTFQSTGTELQMNDFEHSVNELKDEIFSSVLEIKEQDAVTTKSIEDETVISSCSALKIQKTQLELQEPMESKEIVQSKEDVPNKTDSYTIKEIQMEHKDSEATDSLIISPIKDALVLDEKQMSQIKFELAQTESFIKETTTHNQNLLIAYSATKVEKLEEDNTLYDDVKETINFQASESNETNIETINDLKQEQESDVTRIHTEEMQMSKLDCNERLKAETSQESVMVSESEIKSIEISSLSEKLTDKVELENTELERNEISKQENEKRETSEVKKLHTNTLVIDPHKEIMFTEITPYESSELIVESQKKIEQAETITEKENVRTCLKEKDETGIQEESVETLTEKMKEIETEIFNKISTMDFIESHEISSIIDEQFEFCNDKTIADDLIAKIEDVQYREMIDTHDKCTESIEIPENIDLECGTESQSFDQSNLEESSNNNADTIRSTVEEINFTNFFSEDLATECKTTTNENEKLEVLDLQEISEEIHCEIEFELDKSEDKECIEDKEDMSNGIKVHLEEHLGNLEKNVEKSKDRTTEELIFKETIVKDMICEFKKDETEKKLMLKNYQNCETNGFEENDFIANTDDVPISALDINIQQRNKITDSFLQINDLEIIEKRKTDVICSQECNIDLQTSNLLDTNIDSDVHQNYESCHEITDDNEQNLNKMKNEILNLPQSELKTNETKSDNCSFQLELNEITTMNTLKEVDKEKDIISTQDTMLTKNTTGKKIRPISKLINFFESTPKESKSNDTNEDNVNEIILYPCNKKIKKCEQKIKYIEYFIEMNDKKDIAQKEVDLENELTKNNNQIYADNDKSLQDTTDPNNVLQGTFVKKQQVLDIEIEGDDNSINSENKSENTSKTENLENMSKEIEREEGNHLKNALEKIEREETGEEENDKLLTCDKIKSESVILENNEYIGDFEEDTFDLCKYDSNSDKIITNSYTNVSNDFMPSDISDKTFGSTEHLLLFVDSSEEKYEKDMDYRNDLDDNAINTVNDQENQLFSNNQCVINTNLTDKTSSESMNETVRTQCDKSENFIKEDGDSTLNVFDYKQFNDDKNVGGIAKITSLDHEEYTGNLTDSKDELVQTNFMDSISVDKKERFIDNLDQLLLNEKENTDSESKSDLVSEEVKSFSLQDAANCLENNELSENDKVEKDDLNTVSLAINDNDDSSTIPVNDVDLNDIVKEGYLMVCNKDSFENETCIDINNDNFNEVTTETQIKFIINCAETENRIDELSSTELLGEKQLDDISQDISNYLTNIQNFIQTPDLNDSDNNISQEYNNSSTSTDDTSSKENSAEEKLKNEVFLQQNSKEYLTKDSKSKNIIQSLQKDDEELHSSKDENYDEFNLQNDSWENVQTSCKVNFNYKDRNDSLVVQLSTDSDNYLYNLKNAEIDESFNTLSDCLCESLLSGNEIIENVGEPNQNFLDEQFLNCYAENESVTLINKAKDVNFGDEFENLYSGEMIVNIAEPTINLIEDFTELCNEDVEDTNNQNMLLESEILIPCMETEKEDNVDQHQSELLEDTHNFKSHSKKEKEDELQKIHAIIESKIMDKHSNSITEFEQQKEPVYDNSVYINTEGNVVKTSSVIPVPENVLVGNSTKSSSEDITGSEKPELKLFPDNIPFLLEEIGQFHETHKHSLESYNYENTVSDHQNAELNCITEDNLPEVENLSFTSVEELKDFGNIKHYEFEDNFEISCSGGGESIVDFSIGFENNFINEFITPSDGNEIDNHSTNEFHLWPSKVEFGPPSEETFIKEITNEMDFDSIISAPSLNEALEKLEKRIQDKINEKESFIKSENEEDKNLPNTTTATEKNSNEINEKNVYSFSDTSNSSMKLNEKLQDRIITSLSENKGQRIHLLRENDLNVKAPTEFLGVNDSNSLKNDNENFPSISYSSCSRSSSRMEMIEEETEEDDDVISSDRTFKLESNETNFINSLNKKQDLVSDDYMKSNISFVISDVSTTDEVADFSESHNFREENCNIKEKKNSTDSEYLQNSKNICDDTVAHQIRNTLTEGTENQNEPSPDEIIFEKHENTYNKEECIQLKDDILVEENQILCEIINVPSCKTIKSDYQKDGVSITNKEDDINLPYNKEFHDVKIIDVESNKNVENNTENGKSDVNLIQTSDSNNSDKSTKNQNSLVYSKKLYWDQKLELISKTANESEKIKKKVSTVKCTINSEEKTPQKAIHKNKNECDQIKKTEKDSKNLDALTNSSQINCKEVTDNKIMEEQKNLTEKIIENDENDVNSKKITVDKWKSYWNDILNGEQETPTVEKHKIFKKQPSLIIHGVVKTNKNIFEFPEQPYHRNKNINSQDSNIKNKKARPYSKNLSKLKIENNLQNKFIDDFGISLPDSEISQRENINCSLTTDLTSNENDNLSSIVILKRERKVLAQIKLFEDRSNINNHMRDVESNDSSRNTTPLTTPTTIKVDYFDEDDGKKSMINHMSKRKESVESSDGEFYNPLTMTPCGRIRSFSTGKIEEIPDNDNSQNNIDQNSKNTNDHDKNKYFLNTKETSITRAKSESNLISEEQFNSHTRFEKAKNFFKQLELSSSCTNIDKITSKSISMNCKHQPSLDSDSCPENNKKKRKESKYRRRGRRRKDSIKIRSAPTSDTENKIKKYDSDFGGSERRKNRKISEIFHIKDLFHDISRSSDGIFRGIPNKKAVLASLKSVEDLSMAISPTNEEEPIRSQSLSSIPLGYLEEYPYLPTTPPNRFKSRSQYEGSLISRRTLLELDI